jgi:hypothetical protein
MIELEQTLEKTHADMGGGTQRGVTELLVDFEHVPLERLAAGFAFRQMSAYLNDLRRIVADCLQKVNSVNQLFIQ